MLASLSKTLLFGITATGTGITLKALHSSAFPATSRTFSVMAEGGNPKKANSIYEFTAKDISGNVVNLEKYRGHVCVIVNVASKWGKTDVNYKQLVEMYNKHSEADGLQILAFPCNQFGSQEPGTNEEIMAFVGKYGVQFDMFDKIDVNGNHAHPLYEYLKSKQGGTLGNFIKWNFTKFVINKEGQPIARFAPTDDPIPKVLEKCKSLF